MLFYKGWLESRTRLVNCFFVLTALCAYSVIHGPAVLAHSARSNAYSNYIYWEVYSSITTFVFVLCALLLGLGGLLRERAQGTAALSLMIPVSRPRLVITRAALGLTEVSLLALVPVLMICILSPLLGQHYPAAQTIKFAVLWIFGGALYFSVSFLCSSILSGEYTAAAASLLGFFGYSFLFARMAVLRPFNVNGVMSGRVGNYLDKSTHLISGSLPWGHLLVMACVSAAMIGLSALISCRQDLG